MATDHTQHDLENDEPVLLAGRPEAEAFDYDVWRHGSEEKRERKAHDLVGRAHAVRAAGWEPYKLTWSTGEVVQVAFLLRDGAVLEEFGESAADVISRTAFDLYGVTGGAEDRDAGFTKTTAWLDQVRTTITTTQEGAQA